MSLAEQLEHIPSDLAWIDDPATVWANGATNVTAPLDAENAKRLREKMARRYHLWTGRHLWADLKADGTWA